MCGIFGIYNNKEAAKIAYLGIYSLQHRGQESAGIVSSDGTNLFNYVGMGLVADVFNREILDKLKGRSAIAHCRYSTTGSSHITNAQPICVECSKGKLSVAHNGNLTNALAVRDVLEKSGSIFSSTSDSEVIVHLIARSKKSRLIDTVIDALKQVQGAYSLLVMNNEQLIAVRDPYGLRPLSLGKLGNSFVVASETSAFDLIEAKYIRSLEPGEMVIIDKHGIKSLKPFAKTKSASCIFEFIYFSRPDSYIYGKSCQQIRKQLGRELAVEHPAPHGTAYIVPVPDSSITAALGFSEESKIPFEMGLIRNHYIGRTFIEPSQSIRDFGAKIKYNPVREILKGKSIIVVDDSIVRGTTSRKLVKMFKKAGVKEIHWRISCSPIISPCYYGIDTPTKEELIGANHTVKEIKQYLGVDSLGYLSIPGMIRATKGSSDEYCLACFNNDYPCPVPDKIGKSK